MLQALLELLYPPACVACARVLPGAASFCETCDTALERLPPVRCRGCSEPGRFPGDTCPRCRAAPPPFTRAWAPFVHEGPVARAIHRFKYAM
ncbi:double zinc ribbon domain-containing protein [Myxococcus sp. K15C18031901]|uniref:double zinc ribbon domain-containing protein n=1 Tax=Myxococcus dinghuensis TaxID=2906761 RepID=UPI0020A77682|nr:double zinc ribbon domain-containing protein [Myxococcus dinghuensis]MCP3103543.1 double zinc ribbon domain-containing protein [Myxococcus dinghuensis]